MKNTVGTGLVGTTVMKMNKILLARLLDESVALYPNINCSRRNLKILRIITTNNGSSISTIKYQLGGFSQNITFICMIMCRHE